MKRHWWQRLSLTARLVAVLCVTLALGIGAAGAATVPVLRNVLISQKSAELESAAHQYTGGRSTTGDGPGRPTPYYVLVTTNSGERLWANPPTKGDDSAPDQSAMTEHTVPQTRGSDDEVWTVRSATGTGTWLVAADRKQLQDGTPVVVYVAQSLDDIDGIVNRFMLALISLSLVVLPGAGLVGSYAVRRSLRPLKDVEDVATSFTGGHTARRVADVNPDTEVGRVGSSVNTMLDQIEAELAAREASEAKMRRFVGDASHELRTPLAAVRGFAELYRMGAVTTPEDVSSTMGRIESEAKRMGVLVEDLLLLARMDEQRPMQQQPVDLVGLVRDAAQDAHAIAPDRAVSCTGLDGTALPANAIVIGDEGHLRQVVTNLMANAVRHTPAGTPLDFRVGTRADRVVVEVADHGHGIPQDQASKVFERFFRADASRNRARGGGSGLGLAIVAAIVAAHHGHVHVEQTPGGGATFVMSLNAAPTPSVVGSSVVN